MNDCRTVTIKSVVANGIYNDLGFTVHNTLLILVEAQSTWSINIILRILMYLGESINRYAMKNRLNLYGSKKVTFPKPEFYGLYTGNRKDIKRSYSLAKEFFNGDKSTIDLRVKVLKANKKKNDVVTQYIVFTQVLRDQISIYGQTIEAVREAIDICVDKGILKKYLSERREEVISIMESLFDQDEINKIYDLELEVKGAIKAYRKTGMSEKNIIKNIMEDYDVSEEYVNNLLHPAA